MHSLILIYFESQCARRLLDEPRLANSSLSQTPAPKNLTLIDELATEQVLASYSTRGEKLRGGTSGKTEVSAWLASR